MRCALLLLLLLAPLPSWAQAEVVPAEHPVYPFLLAQRAAGHLPEYRHEHLPHDRGTVHRLLDSLSARSAALPALAAYWLEEFRVDLFEPPDEIEVVFSKNGVTLPHRPNSNKYFAYHRTADWRVALEIAGFLPLRYATGPNAGSGLSISGYLRVQGNYRHWLGFYSENFAAIQFTGDPIVLRADPDLAPLYFVSFYDTPPGSFDRSSASLRVANRTFFAELGHQRLLYGHGRAGRVLLGNASDYYAALRVGVNTAPVQFHFLHAALGDRARFRAGDPLRPELQQNTGPERYLAMHRLSVQPFSFFGFGFSEMVVYGLRGPELSYLVPVNSIWTAEHGQWDRDNALFALDGQLRPARGIELTATWLVDDFDFAKIGQQSITNKWAMQAAAAYATGAWSAFAEYTRVEPYTYTHRFYNAEFDSYYNAYQHNRSPLGHPLGPNADQWALGVELWLPHRITADLTARYVRRGENFTDVNDAFVNVGGDLNDGFFPSFETPKQFLGGERFEGPGVRLHLRYEPLRDVYLDLFADYQRWDRTDDTLFIRGGLFLDW